MIDNICAIHVMSGKRAGAPVMLLGTSLCRACARDVAAQIAAGWNPEESIARVLRGLR